MEVAGLIYSLSRTLNSTQLYPPTNADADETRLTHRRSSVPRDVEEGPVRTGGQAKQTAKLKLGRKSYAFYVTTTICGFIGSVFSFICGIAFIIKCPGNWILPCLLILMGASGAIAQQFIISKLFAKDFDGFRKYEEAALNISFAFIILQRLTEFFIPNLMDTIYDSSKKYCIPKFFGCSVFVNAIVILAFVVHYILKRSRRKKKE